MISGVHISSSEMVINKDDIKKNRLPKLIKNQIVNAKVMDLLPRGRARIMVDGKLITAKAAMLLTPGEEVQLKVVQEKDEIVLKLVGPVRKMTAGQVASLVSFFSKNESIPNIASAVSETRLAQVKNLLMEIALKSDQPDKAFLPRLIEKGGISLENKIARVILENTSQSQLKPILANLQEQDIKAGILKELFTAGAQKSVGMKSMAAFSEALENFQLLNHHSSDSGRFLLPFPVFSESAFRFGQLLIDTGDSGKKNSKDGDKLINISFLLDMTRLGPLRADFSILKKEISGRFLMSDQGICDHINALIPELKTSLGQKEYRVRQIECSVARPEQIQPGSLIETLMKSGDDRILNIVV